jgi:chromate transport protein ChrA
MLWLIVFALVIIGGLAVLSFALHLLFSPWLLLLGAGVLVWLWFRPRRSHRTHR